MKTMLLYSWFYLALLGLVAALWQSRKSAHPFNFVQRASPLAWAVVIPLAFAAALATLRALFL